jgi:hypothetical protein
MAISNGATGGWRDHIYKYGAPGWAHSNMLGGGPNSSGVVGAGGYWNISQSGSWDQWLAGHVAVIAYWNRELSDAECATLHTSLAAWLALTPKHLWRMDGNPIVDAIGTSNVRSLTGTVLTTNDSPLPIS